MFLIYEYNLFLFLWRHIVRWGGFKISKLNLGHYLLFYHSKLCQCLVQLRVNSFDPFMKLRVENIHPSVQLLLSALQLLQQVLCVTTKLLPRARTAGKMLPLHVGLKFLSTEVECRSIELFDKGYCTRLEEWGRGEAWERASLLLLRQYSEVDLPDTYQICKIVATFSRHQTVRETKADHVLHIGMETRGISFQSHINEAREEVVCIGWLSVWGGKCFEDVLAAFGHTYEFVLRRSFGIHLTYGWERDNAAWWACNIFKYNINRLKTKAVNHPL